MSKSEPDRSKRSSILIKDKQYAQSEKIEKKVTFNFEQPLGPVTIEDHLDIWKYQLFVFITFVPYFLSSAFVILIFGYLV